MADNYMVFIGCQDLATWVLNSDSNSKAVKKAVQTRLQESKLYAIPTFQETNIPTPALNSPSLTN
jgi:hypothetical protein